MTSPSELSLQKVGTLVAEDFRRAPVFKKHGIEFCCGGGITLEKACSKLDLDIDAVVAELSQVDRNPAGPVNKAMSWTPTFLVDYIESVHHTFVRDAIPALLAFTDKVARVHGHAMPELPVIAETFAELAKEMEAHMAFEEEILFPLIRNGKLDEANELVARAEDEHLHAGGLIERIQELSSDFTPPDWACATYKASYLNLREFQNDLHVHVHLENNVLFPKLVAAG